MNMTQQYRDAHIAWMLERIGQFFRNESLEDWVQRAVYYYCEDRERIEFYNNTVLDGTGYSQPDFFIRLQEQHGVRGHVPGFILDILSEDRERIHHLVACGQAVYLYRNYFYDIDGRGRGKAGFYFAHLAHYLSHAQHPYGDCRTRYAPVSWNALTHMGWNRQNPVMMLDMMTDTYSQWEAAHNDTVEAIRRIASEAVDPQLFRPYELSAARLLDVLFTYLVIRHE